MNPLEIFGFGIIILGVSFAWTQNTIVGISFGLSIIAGIIFYKICSHREDVRIREEGKEEIQGRKIIKEIKNEKEELHSLTESAIIRKNGREEYYIEGVYLEVNLWKQIVNKSLNKQDCFQIENIEQRRIAMKYCLTPDKFLENWKELKLMNRDNRGNALYEYTHNELNEPVKVLVYKDPSTDRTYYSFVPPSITSATRAMAWKFQLTDQEYDNLRFEA